MDVNRRHLIGASAAGFAGALAVPAMPRRAAPLASSLAARRQQSVSPAARRPDQSLAKSDRRGRAHKEPAGIAARVYRPACWRLSSGRTDRRGGATKPVFNRRERRCVGRRRRQRDITASPSTAAAFPCPPAAD